MNTKESIKEPPYLRHSELESELEKINADTLRKEAAAGERGIPIEEYERAHGKREIIPDVRLKKDRVEKSAEPHSALLNSIGEYISNWEKDHPDSFEPGAPLRNINRKLEVANTTNFAIPFSFIDFIIGKAKDAMRNDEYYHNFGGGLTHIKRVDIVGKNKDKMLTFTVYNNKWGKKEMTIFKLNNNGEIILP